MWRKNMQDSATRPARLELGWPRGRWVGAIAAFGAAIALGMAAVSGAGPADAGPVASEPEALRLPAAVNAPGTWSDAEAPQGPLAALGIAVRTRPVGLTGEQKQLQLFGVSAVDGRSAWIDLPDVDMWSQPLIGWYALSPDGRWIGWQRQRPPHRLSGNAPLLGWAVMDTTTGEVRELSDPRHSQLRATMNDTAFSGDSRYLLTSYETPDAPQRRGHQFVAWDVDDGTSTVLERPGHYWLPNIGSAASGVVWARGSAVYRADPATGAEASYTLPQSVITASWGSDDTAFAYIGRPVSQKAGQWRLYAGRSLAEARGRAMPLKDHPGQVLGWRDSRHVVVGQFGSTVQIVDVVTGDVETIDMAGSGRPLTAPMLAGDLWRNPLAAPAEITGTGDPRVPWRWAGGAALAAALAGLLVRRRRKQRRSG